MADFIPHMTLTDGDLVEIEETGEVFIVGAISQGAEDRFHVRLDRKFEESRNLIIRKRH